MDDIAHDSENGDVAGANQFLSVPFFGVGLDTSYLKHPPAGTMSPSRAHLAGSSAPATPSHGHHAPSSSAHATPRGSHTASSALAGTRTPPPATALHFGSSSNSNSNSNGNGNNAASASTNNTSATSATTSSSAALGAAAAAAATAGAHPPFSSGAAGAATSSSPHRERDSAAAHSASANATPKSKPSRLSQQAASFSQLKDQVFEREKERVNTLITQLRTGNHVEFNEQVRKFEKERARRNRFSRLVHEAQIKEIEMDCREEMDQLEEERRVRINRVKRAIRTELEKQQAQLAADAEQLNNPDYLRQELARFKCNERVGTRSVRRWVSKAEKAETLKKKKRLPEAVYRLTQDQLQLRVWEVDEDIRQFQSKARVRRPKTDFDI
eukprot:m.104218 g.104218  ORF g.104218 m.104218 type:complete len:384 (-) comp15747_c0_seq1:334-1485(-)